MQPTRRGSSDRRLPTQPAVSAPSAAQPHVIKRCGAVAGRVLLDSAVFDADTLTHYNSTHTGHALFPSMR
jgi:hypothetical protein